MMGKDVEGMIKAIENIKNVTTDAIFALANGTAYRITGSAEHAGMAYGHCVPVEVAVPYANAMGPVSGAYSVLETYYTKMKQLEDNHYVESTDFHDSVGSPWNELTRLRSAVKRGEQFGSLNYVGDKAGMLAILNLILSLTVDVKWSIIYYHDYIQRGFDYMFNDNNPSLTYTNDLEGKQTIGNLRQDYKENVNLPEESIDPY